MAGQRPIDKVTCAFTAAYGIDDDQLIHAVLATAVNVDDDGEPLWLMVVGPPSGGKTTASTITADLPRVALDDLTAASLLSAQRDEKDGRKWRVTGLLNEKVGVGGRKLWVIEDFSSVLSMSDRGGREQLFSYLRKVYDGRLSRTVAHCPLNVYWEGRLSVLAACTTAIDNQQAYGNDLGPRFVYIRLRDVTHVQRSARLRAARGRSKDATAARSLAASAVGDASLRLPDCELSDRVLTHLEGCAMFASYGRTHVGRDTTWKREVVGSIETEEPFRLFNQMEALARGGACLGLTDDEIMALCSRVARDTLPRTRRDALAAVIKLGEEAITAHVAKIMHVSHKTADHALEELVWATMLEKTEVGKSGPHTVVRWSLTPHFEDTISSIYKGYWFEQVEGITPPSPPV